MLVQVGSDPPVPLELELPPPAPLPDELDVEPPVLVEPPELVEPPPLELVEALVLPPVAVPLLLPHATAAHAAMNVVVKKISRRMAIPRAERGTRPRPPQAAPREQPSGHGGARAFDARSTSARCARA